MDDLVIFHLLSFPVYFIEKEVAYHRFVGGSTADQDFDSSCRLITITIITFCCLSPIYLSEKGAAKNCLYQFY
jgi:hypothetical protein